MGSSGTHMIFSQNDEVVFKVSVELNRGEPSFAFNGLKTGHVASLKSYSVSVKQYASLSADEDISLFAEGYLWMNGRIRTDIYGDKGINISAYNGRVSIKGQAEKDGGISLDGGDGTDHYFSEGITQESVSGQKIYTLECTQGRQMYI